MKKNERGVLKLPVKQNSQSSPFTPKQDWIGCAIQQATSKWLSRFFFHFNISIFIYFPKCKTMETHAGHFCHIIFRLQIVCPCFLLFPLPQLFPRLFMSDPYELGEPIPQGLSYTANVYRQTTDKLMQISVISTFR